MGVQSGHGSSPVEPNAPKLRNFALRLCKTDPSRIFDDYAWNAQALKSRQDTIAWVAARKLLGDVWNKGFDIGKKVDEMDIDNDEGSPNKNKNDKATEDPMMVTPAKVG